MTHDQRSDLVRRARSGDADALDLLLERVHGRLDEAAHQELGPLLHAKVTTSDLVQSSYLEVLGSIRRFPGRSESDFVRWVGRIIRNNARDHRRFLDARKRSTSDGRGEQELVESTIRAFGPTPSAAAATGEEIRLVSRAFSRLPPDYRRVITRILMEGQDHATAAQGMQRSEGAIRVLLCRARAALLLETEKLRAADEGGGETSPRVPPAEESLDS